MIHRSFDHGSSEDMLQPLQLRRLHGLADADGDGRLSLVELLRFSAAAARLQALFGGCFVVRYFGPTLRMEIGSTTSLKVGTVANRKAVYNCFRAAYGSPGGPVCP